MMQFDSLKRLRFAYSQKPLAPTMGKALRRRILLISHMTAVIALAGAAPRCAVAQSPFFQGKSVKVIAAGTPGGTADFRVRALVPFLRKHLPGNPAVLLEFMDGSGGRKAANFMYGNARPDGLTVGALSGGIVALQIMGESGVMYDVDKFIYLGSTEGSSHQVIYTRRELGLDSIDKLRAAPGIRIGSQSVGHVAYVSGRLFGYLIGMKEPKFIAGYTAPEVDAALLRGELDGRSNNPTSVLKRNPEWLEKGVMNFHSILEAPKGAKHPRFGHLPEIESFARSEREIRLLSLWRAFRVIGSPYVLPPGTPPAQVKLYTQAMGKIFADREFHADYEKLTGESVELIMPDAMAKIVKEAPRDAEVIDTLKKLSGAGPLPPR
jgi:tripartite-type tricarboxylate transporter receptor subunit TctC